MVSSVMGNWETRQLFKDRVICLYTHLKRSKALMRGICMSNEGKSLHT